MIVLVYVFYQTLRNLIVHAIKWPVEKIQAVIKAALQPIKINKQIDRLNVSFCPYLVSIVKWQRANRPGSDPEFLPTA
ncbi:hypothetical protein CBM2586_B130537 [Cupriavidus phytorum]|uniref:Uncharacterized protein n=1 Tax=Cupriavidus taiwanensis TaxID=164546 RepID=A0A375CJI1_9BURK|nr:hypothetical protein CBM2586_B130537 [Cupriavidus taiwanensis]